MKYFPRTPATGVKRLRPGRMVAAPIRSPGESFSFSLTIVVVDDNQPLRELLAYGLQDEGYKVRCAQDGEEGWQLLSKGPFDLLITDNDMPGLCGLDLLRRIRARAWVQPAILMSGSLPLNAPDLTKLLAPGVAMGKPFSIAELLLKIRELVPSANSVGEDPISSDRGSSILS